MTTLSDIKWRRLSHCCRLEFSWWVFLVFYHSLLQCITWRKQNEVDGTLSTIVSRWCFMQFHLSQKLHGQIHETAELRSIWHIHVHQNSKLNRLVFDPFVDTQTPDSWSPRPALMGLGPTSVSGRVVEEMASETTFFNQTNNQTKPLTLPFRPGFDFPGWRTIFLFRNTRRRKKKSVHSIGTTNLSFSFSHKISMVKK